MHFYFLEAGWKFCAQDQWRVTAIQRNVFTLALCNVGLDADVLASIIETIKLSCDLKQLFQTTTTSKQDIIDQLFHMSNRKRDVVLQDWPQLSKAFHIAIDCYEREVRYTKRYGMMQSESNTSFYEVFCDVLNQIGFVNRQTPIGLFDAKI